MTYEDFCKRIEEKLSTGVLFVVSNATLSSLLSQETKITVKDSSIYFGIESEEKLYELMAIGAPTEFDGIVHIMLSDAPHIMLKSPKNWVIAEYGSKYSLSTNFLSSLDMDTPNPCIVTL